MTLNVIRVGKGVVFHFKYDTRYEMNEAFIRMSEFSESPSLRGKLFKREDVLQIVPDYYDIVLGHNIPGMAYRKFMAMYDTNEIWDSRLRLSNSELKIRNLAPKGELFTEGDFYLIATCKTEKGKFDAINHEMAHAMWYLIPEYRRAVVTALNYEQASHGEMYYKSIQDILTYKEYDSHVWEDETHAFLVDLGLGSVGFFYGRTFKRFLKQLFAGKIRLHFKYKIIAFVLASLYEKFSKGE